MASYAAVEVPRERSETARRYIFEDGVGEIGIIAPVSHPFCGHAAGSGHLDGKIRTCLFSVWDHDLYGLDASRRPDDELMEFIGVRSAAGRAPSYREPSLCRIQDDGAYRC